MACMAINFHMVESHKKKSGAVHAVGKAILLIHTRWDLKVVFICSDGEGALSFITDLGITQEESASDTPAQNGHFERTGDILIMKA